MVDEVDSLTSFTCSVYGPELETCIPAAQPPIGSNLKFVWRRSQWDPTLVMISESPPAVAHAHAQLHNLMRELGLLFGIVTEDRHT